MTRKTLWIALVIVLGLALIPLARTSAQQVTPPSDDEVNAVAKDLYCPVCNNVTLDVCPTQACAQWRELIREKLSEGWTSAEIKDYFARQYGDQVLPVPPRRGFNLLVYLLPAIVIAGGSIWLGFHLNMMKKTHENLNGVLPRQDQATAREDEYSARIEAELEQKKD